MKHQQRGFTLIELVVVITILGILAAFALPRFSGLESQARAATLNGLAGSIRSASSLVHAAWLAGGNSGAASITLEGAVVSTNANGYVTDDNMDEALQDLTGFSFDNAGVFQKKGATTLANCQVVYDSSTNPPTITPDSSGC